MAREAGVSAADLSHSADSSDSADFIDSGESAHGAEGAPSKYLARASGVAAAVGVASLGLAYVATQAGMTAIVAEPSHFEANGTVVPPIEVVQIMSPENVPDTTRYPQVSVTRADPEPVFEQPAPTAPSDPAPSDPSPAHSVSDEVPTQRASRGTEESASRHGRNSDDSKRGDRDVWSTTVWAIDGGVEDLGSLSEVVSRMSVADQEWWNSYVAQGDSSRYGKDGKVRLHGSDARGSFTEYLDWNDFLQDWR